MVARLVRDQEVVGSNPVASTTEKRADLCRLSFSLLRTSTGFEGGGASGERAVCARIARKHIGWAQTGQPGGLFTGARRQRRKSRRLDQDPETAFLSSRGLCCCEGFEPQPPKRLEMRRLILGCRFMRADASKGCPLAEASRSRDARGRSPSCGSEAIEPLIIPLTSYLPIEAKIIPSPRPKPPQRLPSAEFLFVLRFVCNSWPHGQARSFSWLPRGGTRKCAGKKAPPYSG